MSQTLPLLRRNFFFYFLLILFFHAPAFSQTSAKKITELTLGLNWKPEPQFGGFYEAQRAEEFKKQNLSVKILEGGSGTPTVQMLANGKIDYGIVSAEELIIANEKDPGNKLVALYAVYKTNPQMIMTHAERNFTHLKDVFLSEGTLSVQQGLSYVQYLKKFYHPIKVSLAPYLGGIGNFQSDKNFSQQGFINSEDLLAEKAGLKIKTFLVADSGFNPYTTVVATQQRRLKNSLQEVLAFKKSIQAGWSGYLKSPVETNKNMALLNKAMNLEIMNTAAERQKKLIDLSGEALGEMTVDRWKTLQDQLVGLGLIKSRPNPDEYFLKK